MSSNTTLKPLQIVLRPRLQGYFKMEAYKLDGTRRLLADWFPNLIVDTGLNRIGTGTYLNACHVGTSTDAPANGDTSVGGYLAGTTTVQASTQGAQATPPYYGWKLITYRFPLGAVVGNVGSVAIATAAANGGSTILFSRARVLDEFGAPTTVTVLADEILDVTYECRLYPPLADVTQTGMTITGSGTHTVLTRAANVTSNSYWGQFIGTRATFDPFGGTTHVVYDGPIGAITSSPSGSASGARMSNAAYSNNSLELVGSIGYGMTTGNLAGYIKSFLFSTSLGRFQMEFDPVIQKDDTKTLTMSVKISWARNV